MSQNNHLNLGFVPLNGSFGGTGVNNGSNTLTITSNSLINQDVRTSATPSFVSISTSPGVSQASSLALGSAYKNTLGYDVVLTVYLRVLTAVSGNILCGVGPTASPIQQTLVSAISISVLNIIPITIYLPNNYYALLGTSGTISVTIGGQQAMPV